MNPVERRAHIYRRLQRDGKAGLVELADELGVSSMTIRRDLRQLSDQGITTISLGIAYLTEHASPVVAMTPVDTVDSRSTHKTQIGRQAARLIEDGDTVIVDCGSTTLQLLRFIGSKRLTVITNSIPVAGVVGSNPNVRLIFAPGEYSPGSSGMVGPITVGFFRTLHVDKAFLGVPGFDAEGGAIEPVLGDTTAKCAMLEIATKSYLMADSSKYGNVHIMAMTKLSDYSCIITDSDFPFDKRAELEAASNQVIYA